MRFTPSDLPGVVTLDLEPRSDERGFFARAWCARAFAERGLACDWVQASVAYTRVRGTVRGLHYQKPPHGEIKLVRCVRGAAYVVVFDMRIDSPSRGRWAGFELTAENRRALYVPLGCAQGYQTLEDDTELLYQMTEYYSPDVAAGVRHDDPGVNIRWPAPVAIISTKDQSWPDYTP